MTETSFPTPAVPTPESVRKALRAVKDPELNLNIIDIGLVYDIEVSDPGMVHVRMTLTSPGCPAGTEIIDDMEDNDGSIAAVPESVGGSTGDECEAAHNAAAIRTIT